MTYEKITDFDFKLTFGEQTHSLAYRVAPNVIIARNPQPDAPADDWQILVEHSAGRVQGGLRTRAAALEAWNLICEISDLDPADGLPTDDGRAVEAIRDGILTIRGIAKGCTKPADLDWRS